MIPTVFHKNVGIRLICIPWRTRSDFDGILFYLRWGKRRKKKKEIFKRRFFFFPFFPFGAAGFDPNLS